MTLHAHLLHKPDPANLAALESHLQPGITLTTGPEVPPAIDILIAGRPAREHLIDRPTLRALIIPFAGLPTITRDLMQGFPQIAVHNLHHNAVPTAEMALTLLLAAAKFIVPADRTFRQHDWGYRYRQPNPSIILEGKTALILGYGAVGQHVARWCRMLGMDVIGVKRTVDAGATYPDPVFPVEQLPDLLPRANVLIIAVPLTTATANLIDARALDRLASPAVLVNVGRAAVVDEAALYEALKSRRLHAAGLDVWYNYPVDEASRSQTPPANYPFHELENVILSPHRAGGGGAAEVEQRRMRALADRLNIALTNAPLPDRIDLAAGY
jgi:phosphoglycerate dehydrogenase-like enzyme